MGVHPAFVRPLPGTPVRFLGPAVPGSNGALVATDEAAVFGAIADEMAAATGGRTIGHLLKPASPESLRYATRLQARGTSRRSVTASSNSTSTGRGTPSPPT
ncbi:hypothetical protein ACFQL1_08250 [Halomicroarcula sp. GCM10025709]|uniref:hypothetical protein n=1 Tax=Halomicroarcula sp. GCM10025709 TaxID=3252669 RepID=UPI00360D0858